ncbi:Zn(2)-C6 fungal-type DNA-binding domain [Cordyceps militaris]|uniref:Zn(2)-C6 fungal-type DNA-binding domain n=1 Tax=Cordyceps militaris TaxID=73501 RepID=A0A2H4SB07_CORMI|nr:Zn(2)-C6 fungal-type DNA-binding domain [Cordyceps militaris]
MSTTGKRMRLGTKSCAECRRRKVRCIRPPGQDRCDACQAHGSSCLAQEKSGGRGDESPSSGADDVAVLKKRLDELEMLMRALPAAGRPASAHGADAALTDGSTAASASPHGPSPPPPPVAGVLLQHPLAGPSPLVDAAQISPALQNSPLLSLFRESSIFDPITYADARPPLLTPSAAARLRQCLAQFAPYMPQPERVATFFDATQQYWPTWPPYFYPPGGDADRLGPGQVPRAEQTFHTALVSGRPAQTAKAVLFLALCIQQTPKRRFRSLVPPSVRQQDLVDTYVDTAQTLLQLDDDADDGAGGSTLDAVEAMNMLYKLCINAGRPRRAWSWNRRAITACIARGGLPTAAARAGERAALAWSTAWRAERYMAMTLGLPSATSALHPGLAPLREERAAGAILHSLAVLCGRIIDRDQDAGGDDYATTVQLGAELDEAQRRLFPAHWWAAGHLGPDLDQAAGWFRQSCKVLFLTARQVAHLPYLLRAAAAAGEEAAAAAQYAPSRDAAMDAARGVCAAYCEFRHWARGGAELCQVMDFRAASAALVLLLGHWISSGAAPPGDADAAAVRDVALCLRQTAAVMDCRVAEQAVRTLDVLDAARRGVYLADDDYDVVVPYFGRIRVNKAAFVPPQKPAAAASDFFNTVEFSTNDFLADFQLDTTGEAPAELCGDWADLGLGYASMDWDQSFTCGPFFEVDGCWDDSLLLGGGEGEMKQEI